MTTFIMYTDGSSSIKNNKRCGGIGIFIENNKYQIAKTFIGNNSTNQRMELQACLTAIKYYIKHIHNNINDQLIIRTDSMYLINCITDWSNKWKNNNWQRKTGNKNKEILHLDLIKQLYDLYNQYKIKFEHIKAHQKQPNKDDHKWSSWYGNYMADKLASNAMENGFE